MEAPPSWADPSAPAIVAPSGVVGAGQNIPTAEDIANQHEQALFSDATYSTLDEPVRETILRDVRAVYHKLKLVLQPMDSKVPYSSPYEMVSGSDAGAPNDGTTSTNTSTSPTDSPQQQQQQQQQQSDTELSARDRQMINTLKDWDLWGPLVLCLALSVLLCFKAPTNQSATVFAAVFCIVWVGSAIVTLNAQLLGGTISFFQSVCVLGYSLFPLVIAALVIGILKLVHIRWMWLDLIFVLLGFLWSIRVSAVFIGIYIKRDRRFLALYPVFFYNIFLSWLILLF